MLLSYDYDFWTYLLYIFTIYGYIIIYCNAEFSDVSPHKNEKIQKKKNISNESREIQSPLISTTQKFNTIRSQVRYRCVRLYCCLFCALRISSKIKPQKDIRTRLANQVETPKYQLFTPTSTISFRLNVTLFSFNSSLLNLKLIYYK